MRTGPRVLAFSGAGIAVWLLAACGPPASPAFQPSLQRSRQYYETGEFQKAIDSCQAALERYPAQKPVVDEYIKTLEGIKRRADVSLAARDCAAAERDYSILLNNFEKYKGLRKSLTFTAAELGRRVGESRTGLVEQRVEELLRAGEYEKALGAETALSPAELGDPVLASNSLKTMEEIKRRGDDAAAGQDYIAAGKAYAALAAHYAAASRLGRRLSFTMAELDAGVRSCRTELTRQGLEQYRRGNLSEAIAIWNGVLQFDPANPEIKKAVETAREQQKGLQKR